MVVSTTTTFYNTQQRQQCVHWDCGKKPKSYFVRTLYRSCRGSVSSRDQLWWFNGRNHTHWRSSPNSWKLRRWLLHADCSDRLNTSMETRTQQSAPGLSAPLASRMFTTISPIPEQIVWVSERVEISHLHLWLIQVLKVHPMDRNSEVLTLHAAKSFLFYLQIVQYRIFMSSHISPQKCSALILESMLEQFLPACYDLL